MASCSSTAGQSPTGRRAGPGTVHLGNVDPAGSVLQFDAGPTNGLVRPGGSIVPTPRDLLNEAKASIREVDQADAQALLEGGGVTFLDVREPDEYEQGAIPNAVHLPRGHLEFQVEGKLPDKAAPIVVYCAGGVRSAFAAKTMGDLGYTDVQSHDRRVQQVEGRRPPLGGAADPDAGPAQPLPAPPPAARGGRGGPAEAARIEGAAARRGRPGVAGGALPGRGRRRDDRHHRHGRRRRVQPAAPDPAQHGPDRRPQGRLGQEDADGAEPGRERRHLRRAPRARTTSSTSSTATTSSSTGPTTSRPATSSTTPRCSSGSP